MQDLSSRDGQSLQYFRCGDFDCGLIHKTILIVGSQILAWFLKLVDIFLNCLIFSLLITYECLSRLPQEY